MPYAKLFCVLLGLCLLSACGKDGEPEPSIEERQLALLARTWKAGTVTLDGVDISAEYTSFQLSLQKGEPSNSYSVAGRPPLGPWKSNGTWTFGSNAETKLVRDSGADQVELTYEVTENSLRLTFSFTGNGYTNRASSAQGEWIMTFTP